MASSKAWEFWENLNLEDLYKKPWFFGEISEEEAKKILVEARRNDENLKAKRIFFFKTILWSNGKKYFEIVDGQISKHDLNGQPQFNFTEDIWWPVLVALRYSPFKNSRDFSSVVRKNPFTLEELANVKTATSGVNVETLKLPKMIEDEIKKYQDFNKNFLSAIIADKFEIFVNLEFIPINQIKFQVPPVQF